MNAVAYVTPQDRPPPSGRDEFWQALDPEPPVHDLVSFSQLAVNCVAADASDLTLQTDQPVRCQVGSRQLRVTRCPYSPTEIDKLLVEDAKGIGRTIDAIRHLVKSGRGGAILGRELEFFRKNRARMDYRGARDAGYPIGSGCVESANRFVVQQRMKRSGQRWGREGGQGVLTFRSLLKSGRFDDACRSIVRRRRTNAPVRLPASAPKLALAA